MRRSSPRQAPQYIMLFGKRCQKHCRTRLFATPGTSYRYSGVTVHGQPIAHPALQRAVEMVQQAVESSTLGRVTLRPVRVVPC